MAILSLGDRTVHIDKPQQKALGEIYCGDKTPKASSDTLENLLKKGLIAKAQEFVPTRIVGGRRPRPCGEIIATYYVPLGVHYWVTQFFADQPVEDYDPDFREVE